MGGLVQCGKHEGKDRSGKLHILISSFSFPLTQLVLLAFRWVSFPLLLDRRLSE